MICRVVTNHGLFTVAREMRGEGRGYWGQEGGSGMSGDGGDGDMWCAAYKSLSTTAISQALVLEFTPPAAVQEVGTVLPGCSW